MAFSGRLPLAAPVFSAIHVAVSELLSRPSSAPSAPSEVPSLLEAFGVSAVGITFSPRVAEFSSLSGGPAAVLLPALSASVTAWGPVSLNVQTDLFSTPLELHHTPPRQKQVTIEHFFF